MIRALLATGTVPQKALAKRYGVTEQTISAIHNRLIWKEVQPEETRLLTRIQERQDNRLLAEIQERKEEREAYRNKEKNVQ